jgi:hypothetical protein
MPSGLQIYYVINSEDSLKSMNVCFSPTRILTGKAIEAIFSDTVGQCLVLVKGGYKPIQQSHYH